MAVPSEIRKLLGSRTPEAHASLSSSLQSPIGEVHFVIAGGQLFAFERESLIGEFQKVELDPAHPPKLVAGAFNDVLYVALADGTAHELQVSSFDRDAIRILLEKNIAPATTASEPGGEHQPVTFEEAGLQEESRGDTSEPADSIHNNAPLPLDENAAQQAAEAPQERPRALEGATGTPADVDPDEASEQEKAVKAEAKHGNNNIYYGSDPGCVGCLIQMTVFFGGIVAMWFAHEHAMLNIGLVEPADEYADSPTFVLTKIVAVIAGMYLGGKTASLLGSLFRKLNWTGRVAFIKDRIVAAGPRGRWQATLDSSRPLELSGIAHASTEQTEDSQGKPTKRAFSVFVRVQQNGGYYVLKTSIARSQTPRYIGGLPLEIPDKPPEDERVITMDGNTFRQVLKRLQDTAVFSSKNKGARYRHS